MTPAEIRELIARLRASAKHTLLTEENVFALGKAAYEAATVIDDLLARCEGMEEALRAAKVNLIDTEHYVPEVVQQIETALSGGE